MRSSSLLFPRAATVAIALAVLAPAVAAAQTPVVSVPSAGAARTPLLSPPAFARLVPGMSVTVTRSDGPPLVGTIKSLSPVGVILSGDGFAATVPFDRVVKVEKVTHRVRTLVFIGLASGVSIGIWGACHDRSAYCNEEPPDPLPIALGIGIGAGAGAGLGVLVNALHRNTDVLYDAGRRTTTVSLTPILSPTHTGLAFSMTWR